MRSASLPEEIPTAVSSQAIPQRTCRKSNAKQPLAGQTRRRRASQRPAACQACVCAWPRVHRSRAVVSRIYRLQEWHGEAAAAAASGATVTSRAARPLRIHQLAARASAGASSAEDGCLGVGVRVDRSRGGHATGRRLGCHGAVAVARAALSRFVDQHRRPRRPRRREAAAARLCLHGGCRLSGEHTERRGERWPSAEALDDD